jgi:cell division protein FtsQ
MGTLERLQQDRSPRKLLSAPLFLLLLVLVVVLFATVAFLRSNYVTFGSVIVEGNKYVTIEEIFRAAAISDKINIFRLDTTDIHDRLLQDIRLTDVAVTRSWPATIQITVAERQPVAMVANSYGFVLLDKEGMVLDAMKSIRQLTVPMVTGVRLGNLYVGDVAESDLVKNPLHYLGALDESTLNQLSEVNIKTTGELTAYTVQMITIRLGMGERMEEKASFTREVLRDIGDKKAAVEYVDLTYSAPYIKFRQQK